jgi:predicted GIY-YIG superfamily endonuclease
MYLVYIIKSDNNLYYVGMTNNFFRRWLQHNCILSGGAKYTKKGNNWYPICIIDGFKNKKEAMQCEWKLKNKKNKLSKKFTGFLGRIQYLNLLLLNKTWTNNSPNIIDQNLTIYIDNNYNKYITNKNTKELYWK